MGLTLLLLAALLAAGLMEGAWYRRALDKVALRILVNGTRGKTTVTRLLAAALNEAGIRAYARTTGSQARLITPDGGETDFRGGRLPNPMEHKAFLRQAVKGGAQALVAECMALRPENQALLARRLVRPQYTVLTNALVDHEEEIGATKEQTLRVLALSVMPGGTAVTGEAGFAPFVENVLPPAEGVGPEELRGFCFPVHPENVALALALTDRLGIPRETALSGMRKARPDPGLLGGFYWEGRAFVNAFAANDPDSFSRAMEETGQSGPYALLYNHRRDRAPRLRAFARAVARAPHPPACAFLIGDDPGRAAKYLARAGGLPAAPVRDLRAWAAGSEGPRLVLCAGNIKGDGMRLVERMREEGRPCG